MALNAWEFKGRIAVVGGEAASDSIPGWTDGSSPTGGQGGWQCEGSISSRKSLRAEAWSVPMWTQWTGGRPELGVAEYAGE